MSKREKLLLRLLSKPKDFTYQELYTLLSMLGFVETKRGKTSGSRRLFVHSETRQKLTLHQPHGNNSYLKAYQINEAVETIKKLLGVS